MTASGITVVVTHVQPRRHLLRRALETVYEQTLQPDAVVVSQDNDRRGAAHNRQRGTDMVQTEFVAYLDDDDELRPNHLQLLRDNLRDTADLIYPWFDVVGGCDPFPTFEGKDWDGNQVPVTFLARTESIRRAGGWDDSALFNTPGFDPLHDPGVDPDGNRAGEDYRLILRMINLGMGIQHLNARTWMWHHDSGNTSGLPARVGW